MMTGYKTPLGTLAGHHAGTLPPNDPFDSLAQTNGQVSFAALDQFGWDNSAQQSGQPAASGLGQVGAGNFGPYAAGSEFFPSVSTAFMWSPAAATIPGIDGLVPWARAAAGPSLASSNAVVSTPGSGLVFNNTFGSSCTAQYEACAVAAEKQLESLFTNSLTINETFQEANSGNNGAALGNSFSVSTYTYAQVKAALLKVAPNDVLPATDPSGGANWNLPVAYARMLGLTTTTPTTDDTVTLNTYYGSQYSQDAINGITHELTEGGLGRIGALGGSGSGYWSTMDLFRYTSAGQADYSNGRDGQTTYFSADGGSSVSDTGLPNKGAPTLSYNNQYSSSGSLANSGDTADWVQQNVFGSTGDGETLSLTQTELEVMQALGWHLSLGQDVESSTGSWETPTSWSTGSMPIEAQDAYITGGEVTLDSNVLVNSIATASGSHLVIGDSASSTLTAVDGTDLNSDDVSSTATGNLGEIVVCTGSALQVGSFESTFDNAGTILLGKGAGSSGYASLDITSSVSLTGGGTITLGLTGTAGDILNAPGESGSNLANVNNTLSGGGVINLGGFDNQLDGTVEAQSYLQITAGTFTNEGLMIAEANATLDIGQDGASQSLAETGSIVIEAGAHLAISGNTSISGTGAIGFKGAGGTIGSDGTPATFTNAGNIDADYNGQIGDADLTFVNTGAAGAVVSGVTLTINTGANTVTNTGTLAAENGGTLAIVSNLNNSGGLEAGISSSNPNGTIDLGADGGTGMATDTGYIEIYGGGDLAISGNYTIAGGAATQFKGAGAAITSDGNAPATFTNASIIEAFYSGQIGDVGIKSANDLTFTNTGTVVANTVFESTTTLTLDTGANAINDSGGLIEAEGGATLVIDSAVTTGTSGTIEAESGTVTVNAAVSGSGTLSSGIDTDSILDLAGGGSFAGTISGEGTVLIGGATTLHAGASLAAWNVVETANLTLASVAVTNSVGNTFTMTAASGAKVFVVSSGTGSKFTNAGTLLANGAGTAVIGTVLADTGLVSATSGTLLINGPLSGTGSLSAGAGAVLDMAGGGSFAGAISGAGTVKFAAATTLYGAASLSAANVVQTANLTLSSVAFTNAAADDFTITAAAGAIVKLASSGTGKFTNAGSLVANGAGTAEISAPFINSGMVSASSGTLLIEGALSGSGSLAAGAGAMLDIAAGGSFAGAITGAGTVKIAGGLKLQTGASLSATNVVDTATINLASVAITNAANSTFAITAGTGTTVIVAGSGSGSSFTNAGTLVANGAGTAHIGTKFVDTGTASATSGTLLIEGPLAGTGSLSAGAGAVLDMAGGGSFGGAISGAGTVKFAAATTLYGAASLSAANVIETANLALSSVAVTNAAGDTFAITAASGATVKLASSGTGRFINAGSLVANGAGTASIGGPFTNSGIVSATTGTLAFLASVGGSGTLDLGAAGTLSLELGAGSGQTVDFLSATGALDLSHPLDFGATIAGFGGSDQVFLENTAYTASSYTNNILSLTDNGTTVARLYFAGSSNSFSLASENHGVLITFG
jgi:hypothetical protein